MALQRLRQFGAHLPGSKQAAITRADASNTVVHPFFLHATAAIGMNFYTGAKDLTEVVRTHAKHAQLAMEQLVEVNKGNDPHLKAQVYLIAATGSLFGRWFDSCRQCLTKAGIALNAAKLQFIPITGRPPELTEDVLERLAILSQNIYFENYMFLAVDGKEPKMTARIEEEFRYELPASLFFPVSCGVDLQWNRKHIHNFLTFAR